MVVGRITAVGMVVMIGVVVRIQRMHVVEVSQRIATWRRRSDRIVTVVVEAVRVRAVVIARTRSDTEDHPRLVAIAVPAEAHRLEVLEGGEAVELASQFIVRHHRIDPGRIRTVGGDRHCDSLDSTGADSHVLSAVVAPIVRIEVDEEVSPISIVSNVLDIIIDSDRIGVVGQHGL